MTNLARTLYLLADGTHADPKDCEPDADGVLRHIYGMPVSLDGNGDPMTVGGGAVENKNVLAAQPAAEPAEPSAEAPREMEPEPKPEPAKKAGYKTRKA